MFGLIKRWKALEAKGIMGINRRNADYVLKYNKRHPYPIVDDKIITKERAIKAGIHVPQMYGVISTEKEIDKLDEIIGGRSDFVIKPAQGAGGDGILVIAEQLGMQVIAEGVETEAQVAFLRDNGCNEIQGYFVSRPVPAVDIFRMMSEQGSR